MEKINYETINEIFSIEQFGQYIVLNGRTLYVCNADGTLVFHRTDFVNIRKCLILSDHSILVDCGKARAYVAFSLEDGKELWRVPHPRMDYSNDDFALSPDGEYVYDICWKRDSCFFIRISLRDKSILSYKLKKGLRAIRDLMCDSDGNPCILETHFDELDGRDVSYNAIRCEKPEQSGLSGSWYWKKTFQFDFPRISKCFLKNTDTVLTEDLWVYDTQMEQQYSLIENEYFWEAPGKRPSSVYIDTSGRYLILMYQTVNVVIDIEKRKMVARYQAYFKEGCLIGNEFWVSTGSSVLRKPFPLIEDIPPVPMTYF